MYDNEHHSRSVDRILELSSTTLSVGGVKDTDTILSRPGQVETHDFTGCLRSLRVDGLDLLRGQPPADQRGVTEGCGRATTEGQCGAGSNPCAEGTTCEDHWDRATCRCPEGKTGPKCDKGE